MAAHNQVRVLGYLLSDPAIYEDETGDAKIYLAIRACNRAVDGYPDSSFQDLLIFYDGASEDHNRDKLMTRLKSLVAYDLVDIKGVINVLSVNKPSICPSCGEKNVKVFGVSCFIYPITVIKLDGLQASADYDEKIPERILQEHYAKQQEFKNRAAYKYGLLSGEVKDKWETVIEQEKINAQKKKDITNKEEAAKSEELAEETLKSDKEEVVQWYIDALYDRTLYTDIVKKMIDDANTALAKCTDLSNYNTLSSNLSEAVSYAENLPTKESVASEQEAITMPSEDDYPVDE